jgi:hypothetical protein
MGGPGPGRVGTLRCPEVGPVAPRSPTASQPPGRRVCRISARFPPPEPPEKLETWKPDILPIGPAPQPARISGFQVFTPSTPET